MGKRGRILTAMMAVVVVGIMASSFFAARSAPPEPMYRGKPLSYWLRGYANYSSSTNLPSSREADAAVLDAGPEAIPTLVRLVQAHDPPLKASFLHWAHRYRYFRENYPDAGSLNIEALYGFSQLGPAAWPAVPDLTRILDQNTPQNSVVFAAMILAQLGPHADAAVPSLLRLAAGSDEKTRATALMALGPIRANPEVVVPVLVKALRDPYTITRAYAAGSLGEFGAEAKSAVPELVAILREPANSSNSVPVATGVSFTVHTMAVQALRQIDPDTYAKVVTNALPR